MEDILKAQNVFQEVYESEKGAKALTETNDFKPVVVYSQGYAKWLEDLLLKMEEQTGCGGCGECSCGDH